MTVSSSYSVTLPAITPPVTPPIGPGEASPPERLLFASLVLRNVPPWLQRAVGRALLMGIGSVVDALDDRVIESARLRFPRATQADALGYLGRDRRIVRGPSESAATYAIRLLTWWSDHRGRGGAFALLRQLRAFWPPSTHPTVSLVAASGLHHQIDAVGSITHDVIAWTPGDGGWCRLWVVYESATPLALSPTDEEAYRVVPRTWLAAHVQRATVIVLAPGAWLWGYPTPPHAWGEPALTWGGGTSFVTTVEG